jgi:hypothetical protein
MYPSASCRPSFSRPESLPKLAYINLLTMQLSMCGNLYPTRPRRGVVETTTRKGGGDDRDRTGDLLRAREALSQLSYVPGTANAE